MSTPQEGPHVRPSKEQPTPEESAVVEQWVAREKEASTILDLWQGDGRGALKSFIVAQWRCRAKGCMVATLLDMGPSVPVFYMIYREAITQVGYGEFGPGDLAMAFGRRYIGAGTPEGEEPPAYHGQPDIILRRGWTCEVMEKEDFGYVGGLPSCPHGAGDIGPREIREAMKVYRDGRKAVLLGRGEAMDF